MTNILAFRKPFAVTITHGEGVYTAECDELHLVTEAATFEELTARVWEIAPDMIEANQLDIDPKNMRFDFQYLQSAVDKRVAM